MKVKPSLIKKVMKEWCKSCINIMRTIYMKHNTLLHVENVCKMIAISLINNNAFELWTKIMKVSCNIDRKDRAMYVM